MVSGRWQWSVRSGFNKDYNGRRSRLSYAESVSQRSPGLPVFGGLPWVGRPMSVRTLKGFCSRCGIVLAASAQPFQGWGFNFWTVPRVARLRRSTLGCATELLQSSVLTNAERGEEDVLHLILGIENCKMRISNLHFSFFNLKSRLLVYPSPCLLVFNVSAIDLRQLFVTTSSLAAPRRFAVPSSRRKISPFPATTGE